MIQLDLFQGASHLHRTCDPQTSVEAAEALHLGECQAIALEAAKHLCRDFGDASANEIGRLGATLGTANSETIRKRVRELADRKKLIEIGTRPCRITGKRVAVYKVAQ